MSTTTLPLRIKREHLPVDVITSTAAILDDLARNCVEMYEKNLATRGQWITAGDREELVRPLKADAKMSLTMSVEVNEKKMDEDWMIYPKEKSQTTLDNVSYGKYDGNPDVTLTFPSDEVIRTDLETMGEAAQIAKNISRGVGMDDEEFLWERRRQIAKQLEDDSDEVGV